MTPVVSALSVAVAAVLPLTWSVSDVPVTLKFIVKVLPGFAIGTLARLVHVPLTFFQISAV